MWKIHRKKWYKKRYQVLFIDEWDNLTEVGWYDTLEEAEPDVNSMMEGYKLCEDDEMDPGATPTFGVDGNQGRLEEYAGSFGPVFDRQIPVEQGCLQVRGFVRY